ncbi:hypothetical protein [Helicobacter cinaedi]|uniref:hypothetical protein n=1 Tax=Helicobacter cinaedi TaxID=213 RepID=UPI001FB3AC71|nr:hypothetical protein [Helicobacter cinaedi]
MLKIVFVCGANIINTLFNGSVSLSFIPQIAPVIPEPPEVEEPEPESPETELPEVDSISAKVCERTIAVSSQKDNAR